MADTPQQPQIGNQDFARRIDELCRVRARLKSQLDQLHALPHAGGNLAGEVEQHLGAVRTAVFELAWPMAAASVSRYQRPGVDADELQAAAAVGLMRAVETYVPGDTPFATWSWRAVKRSAIRVIRDSQGPPSSPSP